MSDYTYGWRAKKINPKKPKKKSPPRYNHRGASRAKKAWDRMSFSERPIGAREDPLDEAEKAIMRASEKEEDE